MVTYHDVEADEESLDWETIKCHFEPDGSLKDILIPDTCKDDWDLILNFIRNNYDFHFTVDGEPAPLPKCFAEIQSLQETAALRLAFHLEGIEVWCVFFYKEEIELSFRSY